jgi:hypothetical protein
VYRATRLVLLSTILLASAAAAQLPSVGVAGPSQVITIPTGENTTSYLRLYNDGNASGNYGIEIQGNVSSIAILEAERVSIPPGENRRVEITYVAPVEESFYDGIILVSLEGEQIVPGITREVAITVRKPLENRPPRLSLPYPEENATLSGDVDVVAKVDDPDGDSVGVTIYIDGKEVSDVPTYVWRTRRWEDGEHEVKVIVTDGKDSVEIVRRLLVSNPRDPTLAYAGGAVAACLVALALVLWHRRRS